MIRFFGCAVIVLLLLTCTPKPVTTTGVSHETCPPVSEHPVDTLGYTITFSSDTQREQFVRSFRSFLKDYPFAELRNDTLSGQVVIRLAPYRDTAGVSSSLSPVELTRFSEGAVEGGRGMLPPFPGDSGSTLPFVDSILPKAGGTLRLYLQRTGIDGTFLPLVTVDPFSAADSTEQPLFTVAAASPRKITLTINGRLVDGTGKVLSALDLIEAWTGFVKKHPAEGMALFRHVAGVKEFVAGREAVIRGIGAVDRHTCYFRLTKNDPMAVERLKTRRICGSVYSKIGVYFPARTREKKLLLLPNGKTGRRQAFLDTIIISVHDDPNPILSFSLKKYDAITLLKKSDVSYARSTLEKQASLQVVSQDRYFVSCTVKDESVRRFIASRCNGGDLLRLSVKGSGRPLARIETDTGETVAHGSDDGNVSPSAASQRIRILFRKDDDVSRAVAEKLLADISGAGLQCVLAGEGATGYERALVERNYECAVGWVPQTVLTDSAERLRLATLWFQDETDETERLAGFHEIPLFAIDRYLLLRQPAGLYHGRVDGLYAASTPMEPAPAE